MRFNLVGRLLHKLAFMAPGGRTLRPWLHSLRGVKIGKNVWIAPFTSRNCIRRKSRSETIAPSASGLPSLPTSTGAQKTKEQRVVIEKDVFIGPHCIILSNVTIGEGAVIRAGSVVSTSVPPHALCGTPPSDVLGMATIPLTSEHTYEEFASGIRPRVRPGDRARDWSSE